MNIVIKENRADLGVASARLGAEMLRKVLAARAEANIIVATGSSQFETLGALVHEPNIRWDRVTAFHLDEYVGLPITHPASFRLYLWERFVKHLPLPLKMFYYVNGDAPDPHAECRRLGGLIRERNIDVAFIGIGENGHIAFNDPPADFETEDPFPTLNDVPRQAISMSVKQIIKSSAIVCTVPDQRKAEAVRNSMEGPVTPSVPASILQKHQNCMLMIDKAAASLLGPGSGR